MCYKKNLSLKCFKTIFMSLMNVLGVFDKLENFKGCNCLMHLSKPYFMVFTLKINFRKISGIQNYIKHIT